MKTQTIFLSILLGFLAPINYARGGTFSDDFSKGLDASYWGVVQSISNFYIVDVSQGDVRLTKGSTANPGGLQNVTIYLNLALFGGRITNDFSVQIDYSNAVVSGPGLDQVELHTRYQDGSIYYIVYDNSRDYNVHVWDGYSESGITAVSQNYGTFRIARTNDVVTAYFNDTPIYSLTRSSPLIEISFVLQNNQGSDDNISVTFDNFSLSSDSVSPPSTEAGLFYFVNLTDEANFSWASPTVPDDPRTTHLPGAPVGKVTLGGIPFDIASNTNGKQAWNADFALNDGYGQVSITNFVNIYGATEVYSLINTFWGQPGPQSYAWFVFTGSKGAVYTNYLVGGVDMCDFNFGVWQNNVTSPLTVNVFSCPVDYWGKPGRLDMQKIPLPAEFATQTLVSIVLVDNGAPSFQRVILDGLTVKTINFLPLNIVPNNGQINLTWPTGLGAKLQMNNLLGITGWMDYSGFVSDINGTNTVTIVPSGDKMFFRLQK